MRLPTEIRITLTAAIIIFMAVIIALMGAYSYRDDNAVLKDKQSREDRITLNAASVQIAKIPFPLNYPPAMALRDMGFNVQMEQPRPPAPPVQQSFEDEKEGE